MNFVSLSDFNKVVIFFILCIAVPSSIISISQINPCEEECNDVNSFNAKQPYKVNQRYCVRTCDRNVIYDRNDRNVRNVGYHDRNVIASLTSFCCRYC